MARATVFAGLALAAAAIGAAPVSAQTAAADRYGPSVATYPAVSQPPPAYPAPTPQPRAALRGRMLDWPGKRIALAPAAVAYTPPSPSYPGVSSVQERAPSVREPWRAVDAAPPASARAPQRYGSGTYSAPAYAPPGAASGRPDDGWRPVFARSTAPQGAPAVDGRPAGGQDQDVRGAAYAPAQYARSGYARSPSVQGPTGSAAPPSLAGAPSPAALPTSIYSPAARAASLPPPRVASVGRRYGYDPTEDHSVRFYSVHRAFGIQPDPAPIPPQFFTATADLAAAPGPLPEERSTTTTASGTTHNVRAAPDTSTN